MTPPNTARTIMAHLLTFRPLYRWASRQNRVEAGTPSRPGTGCAASAALLWSAREAIPASRMARPMLAALGVAATLAANADFGAAHGAAGIVLSAWPAAALALGNPPALGRVVDGWPPSARSTVDRLPAFGACVTHADLLQAARFFIVYYLVLPKGD